MGFYQSMLNVYPTLERNHSPELQTYPLNKVCAQKS